MAADGPNAQWPPGDNVQNAIEWFTTDRSRTCQSIEHPEGLLAPEQLLDSARFDVQVNRLLNTGLAEQAKALINAQAEWLIRWMPRDHDPLSLDSAQQAGRAWGILITTATEVLPDQDADRSGCANWDL